MWLYDPSELFLSLDFVPREGDSPSDVANKLTRLLILVALIMWWKSYPSVEKVVLYGLIGIFSIFIISSNRISSNKKENFSPLVSRHSMEVSPAPAPAQPPAHLPYSLPAQAPAQFQSQIPPAPPASYSAPPASYSAPPAPPAPVNVQIHVPQPTFYSVPMHAPAPRELQRMLSAPPLEHIEVDDERPPQRYFTPQMGVNPKIYQTPMIAPRMMDNDFSSVDTNRPTAFNPLIDYGMNDERKNFRSRGMLLEKTEDCVDSAELTQGDNRFYLQDIQPNVYSFSYDPTPINSSIGISYAPQMPQRVTRSMCTPTGNVPLYTRIDPQLIRDAPPGRAEELPPRGPWSETYSDFVPAGSTDISQIYDPRFTGYGDAYRSYRDVPAGQVKYYYTDVDAYKTPNFIVRNKIDHVDLHQPMGNTYSTYPREAALEDVRDQVNDDWMAQSTVFREDMMERLMRPANARNWQLRFAPKHRGANLSTFTSEY
jgi:hypothetical protein